MVVDLTCAQITVGIKYGTVGIRVAEEIGHSQNSATVLKLSQDKLFMCQWYLELFTKKAMWNTDNITQEKWY